MYIIYYKGGKNYAMQEKQNHARCKIKHQISKRISNMTTTLKWDIDFLHNSNKQANKQKNTLFIHNSTILLASNLIII